MTLQRYAGFSVFARKIVICFFVPLKSMTINVEERELRAMKLFRDGYNCCQSVVLAFSDVVSERTGLSEEQIIAVTSGFGGGFARLREVCGSVSGMTFMAGVISPAPAADQPKRAANYALVQELAAQFRELNGSIVCRELLGLRTAQVDPPTPSVRTPDFYKVRPCERLIGSAARLVARKLQAEDITDNY